MPIIHNKRKLIGHAQTLDQFICQNPKPENKIINRLRLLAIKQFELTARILNDPKSKFK